jgi:hypothetical protein
MFHLILLLAAVWYFTRKPKNVINWEKHRVLITGGIRIDVLIIKDVED